MSRVTRRLSTLLTFAIAPPSAAITHFRGDFVASAGLSASLSPSRATQVRMRSP